ncbi:MAG TPA: hypothetical protein VIH28_02060 [Ignavibacteriaceae bacterium]
MKKCYPVFLMLFIFTTFITAQQNVNPIDTLVRLFESFQYPKVIAACDSLLKNNLTFTEKQLIEIYRVKGISEFSLLEEENAKKSFIAILNLDSEFELDSSSTSPKIIYFFNNVKSKYIDDLNRQKELQTKQGTLYTSRVAKNIAVKENLKKAMLRSIVLPGMGHIFIGEKTKGLILTSLSAVSFCSMIYLIFNTNKRQNDYQSETDPNLMVERYNDYNNSYKFRNASIITFAVIWLYSQVDILFFTDFENEIDLSSQKLPQLKYDAFRGIQLCYNFSF